MSNIIIGRPPSFCTHKKRCQELNCIVSIVGNIYDQQAKKRGEKKVTHKTN